MKYSSLIIGLSLLGLVGCKTIVNVKCGDAGQVTEFSCTDPGANASNDCVQALAVAQATCSKGHQ